MENNNSNKKFNILYAVIGISTLVVAVVGATFAYFSASKTADIPEGTTAAAGGLELAVEPLTFKDDTQGTGNTSNDLVPLNLIINQTEKPKGEGQQEGLTEYVDANSQFADAISHKCKDSNGNNVCQIYKIKVTNKSTTSKIQVRGELNLTSTAKNMYWKLIDAETEKKTVEVPGEPAPTQKEFNVITTAIEQTYYNPVLQGNAGPIVVDKVGEPEGNLGKATNLELAGTDSSEFYVIIWLEETGAEQQDQDASAPDSAKTYSGTVTFDAVDSLGNKSGVTATFTKTA